MSGAGGALGSFGRSSARRVTPEQQNRVTFDDVAGIDEAENELVEIVDFLRNPQRYQKLGARIPRGVLLSGPPGTGKTLLARAVAGEAEAPFFSMAASEFVEAIVGVGASRVRDLFKTAKEAAPAIIFIDELDAVGRSRSAGGGFSGGHDEREQTLNQILTEMDGFEADTRVIVLGATNRPEVLDPALLRPGRFDRRVTVSPPDRLGRLEILRIHTRSVPLAESVDLEQIAASTPGMTGADLSLLVNEAALFAARREHERVEMNDFTDAIEKIILGTERSVVMLPADRERTAYHESGHAIVGMLTPGADPVRKISIIPRGQALGVTLSTPEADRYGYEREELRGRIKVALGGRAAERVVYGEITTGAESDLQNLTQIARGMVGRWGMSEAVGPVTVAASGATSPLLPGCPGGLRAHAGAGRRGGAPHRRGGRARDDRPHRARAPPPRGPGPRAAGEGDARPGRGLRDRRGRATRRRRGPRHGRGAPRSAGAGNALTGSRKRPLGTTPPRQGGGGSDDGGDVREGYYEAERRKWDEIAQHRGGAGLRVRDRDFGAYCARVSTMAGIAGFLGDLRGAEVLELGCGMGELTTLLALSGARVTAVDISGVSVDVAGRRAELHGVRDRCSFVVGPAETLPFADGSFDAVVGKAVLHHLDHRAAATELERVMRPGARAAFAEPLGTNPALAWARDHLPYPGKNPVGDDQPLTEEALTRVAGAVRARAPARAPAPGDGRARRRAPPPAVAGPC